MKKNYKSCNFLCSEVESASVPYFSLSVRIQKKFWKIGYSSFSSFKNTIYHKKNVIEMPQKTFLENETLNLQLGEWVEVRSIDEISMTLNEKGKYKGLFFMPEMEKFCGKKFKVVKRTKKIKLESTGEVKELKSPTVFLEGVYCNGENHEGCDRGCFHFWREVWLKRISDN
jgi:hypothetical protein